jgi:hypothetical protein
MASRKTGRAVGRPRVPLRKDPDRYQVAAMHGVMLEGASMRKAAMIATVFSGAARETPASNYFMAKMADAGRDDGVALGFELIKRPGAPHSLEGRAVTIRKSRQLDARDKEWLFCMSTAFAVCFNGGSPYSAKQIVARLAARAGETAYAEAVLFPMIDAIA